MVCLQGKDGFFLEFYIGALFSTIEDNGNGNGSKYICIVLGKCSNNSITFFLGDRFTHPGNIMNRIGSIKNPVLLGVGLGLGLANDGLGSMTVVLGFMTVVLGSTAVELGSTNVGNRGSGSGGGGGVDNIREHFLGNHF